MVNKRKSYKQTIETHCLLNWKRDIKCFYPIICQMGRLKEKHSSELLLFVNFILQYKSQTKTKQNKIKQNMGKKMNNIKSF